MNLKTRFDGLSLNNPLMPASGPLVGDLEKLTFMQDAGVGAIVTKTISTKSPKIPKPCIYAGKNYIMNSELWSEHSMTRWLEEILPAFKKTLDRPLIISVGYSKEDMKVLIPKLDAFASAFEISTHYVGTDLNVIYDTVKTIRGLTKKPFYMKISPHMPDAKAYAETIKKAGANGVAAINSLGPTMNINLKTRAIEYGADDGFVWTSGPAIKPLALATIYKIKQAEPTLTVLGVGGVASAEDVLEFMLAGADGVQMLSAALLKGVSLYEKIIKDLPKALEKYGFDSIEAVKKTRLENRCSYEDRLPTLIEDKCVECMLCVKTCPYFAITFEDKITFNPDKCFSCGLCVSICPTNAIKMANVGE